MAALFKFVASLYVYTPLLVEGCRVSAVAAVGAIFGYIAGYNASVKVERSLYQPALKTVKLPPASKKGYVSVEEALWRRRSIREYGEQPLDLRSSPSYYGRRRE